MTMTTSFNIFVKKSNRRIQYHLEIGAEIPRCLTKQVIEDSHKGIGLSKFFTSVKELIDDLNADD